MKKLLLAAAIAVGASTVSLSLHEQQIEAQAKDAELSANFVKSLKKGTLPRAKGKVGMTYSAFLKKGPKIQSKYGKQVIDKSAVTNLNDVDYYSFNKKVSSKAKINKISRNYNYFISYKSVVKNFGKPLRGRTNYGTVETTNIYKAGKYYFYYNVYQYGASDEVTEISIGTKSTMMKHETSTTYVDLFR